MAQLSKTTHTLDELQTQDAMLADEIKAQQKQRKLIKAAIKSLRNVTGAALKGAKKTKRPRARKSAPAASAA